MQFYSPVSIGASLLATLLSAVSVEARVVGRLYHGIQATVKIEVTGGPIIYLDPNGIVTTPADADYILLTHNHSDHQSSPVLSRVRKPGTVFISSPPGVPALQRDFPVATIRSVTPGDRLTLGSVEIETVPMYNLTRSNHPRVMNFVGYVLNIGGVRVYHAGDTARIPEMRTFAVDVAMLPLGQTFTMDTAQDAVASAIDVQARVAIPIHWGIGEGTGADADYFVAQLSSRMQALKDTPPEGLALEISETIVLTEQPASQTVAPGGTTALAVTATGAGALRYQWRRNGEGMVGATTATLTLARASADNAGDYEVIVTDANGPVRSRMARVIVATPEPGRLVNLSVRAAIRGPDAPLIVGAVVEGGGKSLLVRGVGPALATFGVEGAMADPRLDVHADVNGRDTIVASNNDWGTGGAAAALSATFVAVGAFDLPDAASRDAALITVFDGARTVHIADATGRGGVALVELYDTDSAGTARLVNVSARNFAGTGDATLIAGFVIGGNVPRRLLIRGVGPRLASGFGVTGVLADPKLELFLSDAGRTKLFATNDNWAEAGTGPARAAFAATGAFDFPDAGSGDAALVVTVPAGAFTAQVSGVGGTTGEALIEIYELP